MAFNDQDYLDITKVIHQNPITLLVSREGEGKSMVANTMLKKCRKVVFLCRSYQQATEKYLSFSRLKFRTQLAVSRSYKLWMKYKFKSSKFPSNDPFRRGHMDSAATFKHLVSRFGMERASEIWAATPNDEFDFTNDIIISVFNQKHQIEDFDNDDWVVIWDDPDAHDVSRMVQVYSNVSSKIETIQFERHGRVITYAVRPDEARINHGVKLKQMFTTTDTVTSMMIQDSMDVKMVDKRVPKTGGDLYIYGTEMTRKTHDWMWPFFVQDLKNKDFNVELIGDGIHLDTIHNQKPLNHSNSKGNNQLMDKHLLIEVSKPDMNLTDQLIDLFGMSPREAELMVMLDQIHQAIGRNQGERNRGMETHVLVDKNYVQELSNRLEYEHELIKNDSVRSKIIGKSKSQIFKEMHKFMGRPQDFVMKKNRNRYVLLDLIEQLGLSYDARGKLRDKIRSFIDDPKKEQLIGRIPAEANFGHLETEAESDQSLVASSLSEEK